MSELQKSAGFEMENTETPPVRGLSYILAIGIDEYQHCPRLYNAVKDVKEIVSILIERYQFDASHVVPLYDAQATRQNILWELNRMNTYIKPEDEVIILFSGHGTYAKDLDEGFWIPWEGGRSQVFDKGKSILKHFYPKSVLQRNPLSISQAEMKVRDTYVSNRDVIQRIRAIKSFHTLLIVDSCFAGSMFTERNKSVSRDFFQVPSRWLLTSGQMEPVSDGQEGKNSPFAEALIAYLKGSTRHITTSHFFHNLREVVILNTHKKQKPRYEPLAEVGHRGGEFEFHLKEPLPPPVINDFGWYSIPKPIQHAFFPYLLLFLTFVVFAIATFMGSYRKLEGNTDNTSSTSPQDTSKKDTTVTKIDRPKPLPVRPSSNPNKVTTSRENSSIDSIFVKPGVTTKPLIPDIVPPPPARQEIIEIKIFTREVKGIEIKINGMPCAITNGDKILKINIPKSTADKYSVTFEYKGALLYELKDYQLEANPEFEIPQNAIDMLKKYNE